MMRIVSMVRFCRRWAAPRPRHQSTIHQKGRDMAEDLLSGLKLFNRGKVRDIYDLDDKLLLVASDRISAFDVILPTLIPDKGKILTKMSEFWFGTTKDIVRDHLITTQVGDFPDVCQPHKAALEVR